MARQDIAGLLTGISSQRPDPMGMGGNAAQQRLAFGAQRAEGMRRGLMGAMGRDPSTPAEQLQMAMAQLDLSDPNDMRKVAQLQQATGDLAGAAQTAAAIRELDARDRIKQVNYQTLKDLGLDSDAERYLIGAITDAGVNSLINTTRASLRAAAGSKNQRLNYLTVQGIGEDDPLYQLIEQNVDLTDSQFSSLVNQEREARNPTITVTGQKIMEYTDDKGNTSRQLVGTWREGKKGMPVFGFKGFNPETGKEEIIKVTADQVSDVKGEAGLDPTVSDIKSIKILMETAGSEEKGKERWGGIFSTDWNDAWNKISVAQKHNIATFIAQDAMRLNERGMDMGEARVQAVKDYLDTYLKKTGLFEFEGESKFQAPTLEEQAMSAVKRNQG